MRKLLRSIARGRMRDQGYVHLNQKKADSPQGKESPFKQLWRTFVQPSPIPTFNKKGDLFVPSNQIHISRKG